MEWNKGYSSSFYATEVDPITWQDIGRFEIKGGSITRSLDGLRQTASLNCVNYPQDKERWVRIYMDTDQSGSSAHTALFTGLATSPNRDIKGTFSEQSVECYSVLKPAEDVILKRGWYASSDVNCKVILQELLDPVYAPYIFDVEAPNLQSIIVAEDGETNLSMIDRILNAINWNLRIGGDGTLEFGPYSTDVSIAFDPIDYDVIETQIKVASDWFSCPNVFMAVNNSGTAIAKDEDDDSPLSIQNRGREVWAYESNCLLGWNESLQEYAKRRLEEEQQYITTATYDRRYVPDVYPGDLISLHYPAQELSGFFSIISQSIELGYCARTSEDVIGVLE